MRELHDSTSQNLTSLIVGLRMMEAQCANCASPTKATDLREVASHTLDEVHDLSMRLRGERHLGLLGMRERAKLLNGTLTIESTPERGTSIFIEIPLATLPASPLT